MKNQKTKKSRVLRKTISAFLVAFPVTLVFPVTQAFADPAGSAGAVKAASDEPFEPSAHDAAAGAVVVDDNVIATPETDALRRRPAKLDTATQPPKEAAAAPVKPEKPNLAVILMARFGAFFKGLAPDAEAKPWFQAGGIIGGVIAGLTVLLDSSATVTAYMTKLFGPTVGKFLTFGGTANGFLATASGLIGGALLLGGLYLGLRATLNLIFPPAAGGQ